MCEAQGGSRLVSVLCGLTEEFGHETFLLRASVSLCTKYGLGATLKVDVLAGISIIKPVSVQLV